MGRANTALQARKNLISFLSSDSPDYGEERGVLTSSSDTLDIVNVTLKLSDLGRPFFNELNLKIRQGEKVAIVGRSGSGKSTLLKLILGLLTPETGAVLVNGKDVREYERTGLFRTLEQFFKTHGYFLEH